MRDHSDNWSDLQDDALLVGGVCTPFIGTALAAGASRYFLFINMAACLVVFIFKWRRIWRETRREPGVLGLVGYLDAVTLGVGVGVNVVVMAFNQLNVVTLSICLVAPLACLAWAYASYRAGQALGLHDRE